MQAERLQVASRTNNIVVDFVTINKLALRHAPWFTEATRAMCESARKQHRACTPGEAVTSLSAAGHAAATPCSQLPTEQYTVEELSPGSAQAAHTVAKRSMSTPPRAPQRPQTAPLWYKSSTEAPTSRPWTAHWRRSNAACPESELCRARARPGSGGSPTSSCASILNIQWSFRSIFPSDFVALLLPCVVIDVCAIEHVACYGYRSNQVALAVTYV